MSQEVTAENRPVPVTCFTGFLGTLVNEQAVDAR